MRQFFHGFVLITVMVCASACTPRHMIKNEESKIDSIKPENGKAVLVVSRPEPLMCGGVLFETYLDKQMIGVTKGSVAFIKTDVTPGTHYVISKGLNSNAFRIHFEQDRIYYLKEIPVWAFPTCVVISGPQTTEEMKLSWGESVSFLKYDIRNPGDDLPDSEFNEIAVDYERELKEGRHKDKEEYRGFKPKE